MSEGTAGFVGGLIVELLWFPTDCSARISDSAAPCENFLGLTMFETVGFTTKVGTTVLAFFVGLAIFALVRRAQ